MIRSTTNGTLNSYRYHLQRSTLTLNQSRDTMLSQRQFNSFAEDPAAAARSFQLRRSYLRTESQLTVGESVVKKFDMAWSTLDSALSDINQELNGSAYTAIVRAESDTSGAGRNALGQSLGQMAENLIQSMNGRYGDNYIFSGADGLNIPFTWETGEDGTKALYYRGIAVDTAVPEVEKTTAGKLVTYDADGNVTTDPAKAASYKKTDGTLISIDEYKQLAQDLAALDYMSKDETKYEDLGLGLEKDVDGNIMDSSAANTALQGINFLGYGVDEDGDPKNIASIMSRMARS